MRVIWIGYTTRYRKGGEGFKRAAHTLVKRKREACPDLEVRCEAVESKREFAAALQRVATEGKQIEELHFYGHSGMYGIMFGTTEWPEQFSPHEWRTLSIPFAPGARAYFHACRTARWFAPFFARTFGVTAYGHHWYTTFSLHPDLYVWEALDLSKEASLYVISCPGRKSHGLPGSLLKFSFMAKAYPMKSFGPTEPEGDTTYDRVAELYDRTFDDITVREDEWKWLTTHLPAGRLRLLDIGCGNGALLERLAERLERGVGVDRSVRMIELAQRRCARLSQLEFRVVAEPRLDFPDASFDVVVSFMSFRYLDWDPILSEIRRVLVPGGRLLVVDMAAAPVGLKDLPQLLSSRLRHELQRHKHAEFARNLKRLVSTPEWQTMLKYNPIRAEHEYRWYLESRFPGRRMETLNTGWTSRLLAFDSGPVELGQLPPLTYP
ncbi:MAG: class I SAM-dependent methyltransferase [Candidatus Bathyarchaeia archaeon]